MPNPEEVAESFGIGRERRKLLADLAETLKGRIRASNVVVVRSRSKRAPVRKVAGNKAD
jgi:hypothetical protein